MFLTNLNRIDSDGHSQSENAICDRMLVDLIKLDRNVVRFILLKQIITSIDKCACTFSKYSVTKLLVRCLSPQLTVAYMQGP